MSGIIFSVVSYICSVEHMEVRPKLGSFIWSHSYFTLSFLLPNDPQLEPIIPPYFHGKQGHDTLILGFLYLVSYIFFFLCFLLPMEYFIHHKDVFLIVVASEFKLGFHFL